MRLAQYLHFTLLFFAAFSVSLSFAYPTLSQRDSYTAVAFKRDATLSSNDITDPTLITAGADKKDDKKDDSVSGPVGSQQNDNKIAAAAATSPIAKDVKSPDSTTKEEPATAKVYTEEKDQTPSMSAAMESQIVNQEVAKMAQDTPPDTSTVPKKQDQAATPPSQNVTSSPDIKIPPIDTQANQDGKQTPITVSENATTAKTSSKYKDASTPDSILTSASNATLPSINSTVAPTPTTKSTDLAAPEASKGGTSSPLPGTSPAAPAFNATAPDAKDSKATQTGPDSKPRGTINGKDAIKPSGETTFPAYGEYQGNVSESTYHPFLAEVDTLFPKESLREYGPSPYETRYRALDDSAGRFDVLKHWANLSPYYSSPLYPEMQQYKVLASNCKVKQVHMLHRHGARLPTDDAVEAAPHFGQFISNLTQGNTSFSFDGPLTFLNDWTYDLGSNLLTPAGSQQLYDSGVQSYYRYSALYNSTEQKHKPIVRTTSQSRMIDSATYFNLGFFGKNALNLTNLEVLIEADNFNSTLSSGESCSNAENFHIGEPKVQIWLAKYLKRAKERFQRHVQGFQLTDKLVFGMQALCAYETYAVGMSNFCPLFDMAEWEGFAYALDLHFSWNYGFASPTGRAQGVGWGQELISRLKKANFTGPITSQNMTLDKDPSTFPIDQHFYFDFSHDSLLVSALTALNFTQFSAKLDPYTLDYKRNFQSSHLIPFAARLFFEVLECHTEGEKQHYIRAILNDALLPLSQGQGCPPSALKDGLCPLDKFIKHFELNAVKEADYQNVCFGNISVPDTTSPNTKDSATPPATSLN